MKIQTFSIVIGDKRCNARCPYCVSKMTGDEGLECGSQGINYRNLKKACEFAKMSGVSTILLTGKGEPLLHIDQITEYLRLIDGYNFPFIELQTNGIKLSEPVTQSTLGLWYSLGLTTVSLSCVHWDDSYNQRIFGKNYGSLKEYVDILHDNFLSVRLSCVMCKGYIHNLQMVQAFARTCKRWGVEQFTVRPVNYATGGNEKIENWVRDHFVTEGMMNSIERFLDRSKESTLLLELAHGAKVYDYMGQNLSLSSCLTSSPNPDDIRQLIFFPDGHLKYSWTEAGAILF